MKATLNGALDLHMLFQGKGVSDGNEDFKKNSKSKNRIFEGIQQNLASPLYAIKDLEKDNQVGGGNLINSGCQGQTKVSLTVIKSLINAVSDLFIH